MPVLFQTTTFSIFSCLFPSPLFSLFLTHSVHHQKGDHETSLFFVVNINFFGQNQGFTLLLNFLQEEKLNLYYTKFFLKPIVNVRTLLSLLLFSALN
jgi:hypothetical protein